MITIKRTDNGCVVTYDPENEEDHVDSLCFIFDTTTREKEDLVGLQTALYQIMEWMGYYGSKHDKYRLFIKMEDQEGNEVE